MQTFPNTIATFVDEARKIAKPWIQYLQQFTTAPAAFKSLTVGKSPFVYTAVEPGFVYIKSGTVSVISLKRGSIAIDTTGLVFIPVGIGDAITITYSVVPTVYFIPSFGAAIAS